MQFEPEVSIRLVCIEFPLEEDVESAVSALNADSDLGRKQAGRLARRRKRLDGLSSDSDGKLLYNGRRCCGKVWEGASKNAANLRVGGRYLCSDCGAVYEVVTTVAARVARG